MSEQTSPQSGGGTRSAREILSVLLAAEAVHGPFIPEEHDDEPDPLTAERLAEIARKQPGEWLPGAWVIHQVEEDGESPDVWQVIHQASGQVLATLPGWAGNLALWMADTHEELPAVLAETIRLRAEYAEAAATVARLEQHRVEVEKRHNADRAEREELRQRVAELEARVKVEDLMAVANGPGDFYRVGHTYAGAYGWRFRVDHITTHPEDGEREALGWRFFDGRWDACAYSEGDWEIAKLVGIVDEGDGHG